MFFSGKKILADFDTSKAILHFNNETTLTFTITEKDGIKTNIVETVSINITEIREDLWLISWKEISGTMVLQVHDYNKNVLYSNWILPGENIKSFKGRLTSLSSLAVEVRVESTPERCWKLWTTPDDILHFNNPIEGWHTAKVEIDLKNGGDFFYRMEARDGTAGFDFAGIYNMVIPQQLIEMTGTDERKTIISFKAEGKSTIIRETFEPDPGTPLEVQKDFCQSILKNFKKYAEME